MFRVSERMTGEAFGLQTGKDKLAQKPCNYSWHIGGRHQAIECTTAIFHRHDFSMSTGLQRN